MFTSCLVLIFVHLTININTDESKSEASGEIMFEDQLDGKSVSGWKQEPERFVDHPGLGPVLFVESKKQSHPTTTGWVGDESWKNYRIEVELFGSGEAGGFLGFDFHVCDNGRQGCNIGFFSPKEGDEVIFEAAGCWNPKTLAWKLWPFAQRRARMPKEQWNRIHIDVGERIANVNVNDDPQPVYTAYDLPFDRGGFRFWEFYGSGYFRNLRITALDDEVKPILDDPWGNVNQWHMIREWEITEKKNMEYGNNGIPEILLGNEMKWEKVKTDRRGIINLSARFPDDLEKGVVFAKTIIKSEKQDTKTVQISYTDQLTMWCNGKQIFQGPARGFYDPGRSEADGFGRLLPDLFVVEMELQAGENMILLRSVVTEPLWGWGFWMRKE
ncbi:MAG: hypothetical protein C4527_22605 [Candidatus Omnitrophota bacterium]|jgi:hypothetical protein|nr:MAG: hypothetical protein C4527_22605 [Candidatus Omnitrophota bacterium]